MTQAGTRTPYPEEIQQSQTDKENGKPVIKALIAALREVQDPEIPLNIYELGLIYKVDATEGGFVEIDMTLTAPGCPVAGDIVKWVQEAIQQVDGVDNVRVNLVFDPPWDQSKMSDEAKLELGLL